MIIDHYICLVQTSDYRCILCTHSFVLSDDCYIGSSWMWYVTCSCTAQDKRRNWFGTLWPIHGEVGGLMLYESDNVESVLVGPMKWHESSFTKPFPEVWFKAKQKVLKKNKDVWKRSCFWTLGWDWGSVPESSQWRDGRRVPSSWKLLGSFRSVRFEMFWSVFILESSLSVTSWIRKLLKVKSWRAACTKDCIHQVCNILSSDSIWLIWLWRNEMMPSLEAFKTGHPESDLMGPDMWRTSLRAFRWILKRDRGCWDPTKNLARLPGLQTVYWQVRCFLVFVDRSASDARGVV